MVFGQDTFDGVKVPRYLGRQHEVPEAPEIIEVLVYLPR